MKKKTQQFIEEASLKHNGFYIYPRSEYVNNKAKVTITCPVHGDFKQRANNHLEGQGCSVCSKKKKTTQQFIEEATLKHDGFYTYPRSEYVNNKAKVTITCPVHGDFDQTAKEHLRGKGCSVCSKNKKKSTQQFIEEATLKHNGFYTYPRTDYVNDRTKVTITCPVHGDFDQKASNHLQGHGCHKCSYSISKPSQKWLDYLGISNIMGETREVKLKLGEKTIIVDGYDPQTNTIYEFHGDFWHGNPAIHDLNEINRVTKKTFGQLLEKTQKRSKLIKLYDYNLVSIWESDWEKIQNKVLDGNISEG